jgi:hypothetical protein
MNFNRIPHQFDCKQTTHHQNRHHDDREQERFGAYHRSIFPSGNRNYFSHKSCRKNKENNEYTAKL